MTPRVSGEANKETRNVVNVNEIPRLRAASKQGWGFLGAHLLHEDGNDAGVRPLAALTRALDVEEAQRDGFPSLLSSSLYGLLVGPLAVGVGRLAHTNALFGVRQAVHITVDGGG